MGKTMPLDWKYRLEEAEHQAQYAARWTGGFVLRQAVNVLAGSGSVSVARKTLDALNSSGGVNYWGAISSSAFGLGSIALGTGVRAYLNHKEMQAQEHLLTNYYRRELGAKLRKHAHQVTVEDLHQLAETNPAIEEELKRNRKKMHMETAAWAGAALLALFAVVGVVAAFPAIVAAVPSLSLWGAGQMIVGVTAGFIAHHYAENIIESVAGHVMKLDTPSTVERIHELERARRNGYNVLQSEVMGVYVAASPELQGMIKSRFGKSYDRLSEEKQAEAMQHYGPTFNLRDVTLAINENRMSARELTFSIYGDRSGAYPEPTLNQQVKQQLSGIKQSLSNGRAAAAEKWVDFKERSQDILSNGKEWVKSLGLKPKDQSQSWSEQMAARKESLSLGGPTPAGN